MSVIILSNEDVRDLVPPAAYVDAVETAYREYALGRAVIQPRVDLYTESPAADRYSVFKSMIGALAKDHLVALRINSDVISWTNHAGNMRKEKVPAAEGGRWVGLVFVFDTLSGELRAIFPDGEIQRRRVAATTAVAIRHLARRDAKVIGIYGSGSQGEGAVRVIGTAMPHCELRLWSPNPDNRRRLVERCQQDGINVRCMDEPDLAARGADAIVLATNALDPVIEWDWIDPGTLVTCVKAQELGEGILSRVDRIVLHTRDVEPTNYMAGDKSGPFKDTDFTDRLFGAERGKGDASAFLRGLPQDLPELFDIVTGEVEARVGDGERVVFLNPVGNGLQFAAISRQIIDAAEAQGVGQRLPAEWFSEELHP
jgi:alanine dehydrogenase